MHGVHAGKVIETDASSGALPLSRDPIDESSLMPFAQYKYIRCFARSQRATEGAEI